jgi:hypothetical protein
MQYVVSKGRQGPGSQISRRNIHRRHNGCDENYAFEGARRRFEVVLSIATRTARHVGLIDHHHFGGRWRWRHDSFRDCR